MTIKTFLWFDRDAEAAVTFYTGLFPDSRIDAVHRAPGDYPAGQAGDVLTIAFTLFGRPFVAMNGGPGHPFTDAISLTVETADQADTDRYWHALTADGGAEVMCGWCRDRWGVSWQITPRVLMAALAHPDRAAAKRAFTAMMGMVKIDVAAIEAALAGCETRFCARAISEDSRVAETTSDSCARFRGFAASRASLLQQAGRSRSLSREAAKPRRGPATACRASDCRSGWTRKQGVVRPQVSRGNFLLPPPT